MDAVIAWVDGSDVSHQQKFDTYKNQAPRLFNAASSRTRFASNNEIYYCIASIFKFAPFIRKVWIVTDGQIPPHLNQCIRSLNINPDRVEIVDHTIIFRGHEKFLPTFNSISIASSIWRIPGLSSQFVYFNDDVFLTKPIAETTFFVNNKAVIYADFEEELEWYRVERLRREIGSVYARLTSKTTMARSSKKSAKLLSWGEKVPIPRHHPHPFNRNLIENFFEENTDIYSQQISSRFRSPKQFLASTLYYCLMIEQKKAVLATEDMLTYISFSTTRGDVSSKVAELRRADKPFACIQSLDLASERDFKIVTNALNELIGPFGF